MALLAGSPSLESRIEGESLIAEDAQPLQIWMPRIEQDVAFDRDECGLDALSCSASTHEPLRAKYLERSWSWH
jgi:hypothetical protein